MQHTIGQKSSESKSSSKYRDGSAHPHGGSDAQYYHTVTAVRRLDHAKSPMTKMMDLFRHRSNSATSEADKRKAVGVVFFLLPPFLCLIFLTKTVFIAYTVCTESGHNASTSNGYTECNNAKSIGWIGKTACIIGCNARPTFRWYARSALCGHSISWFKRCKYNIRRLINWMQSCECVFCIQFQLPVADPFLEKYNLSDSGKCAHQKYYGVANFTSRRSRLVTRVASIFVFVALSTTNDTIFCKHQ